MPHLLTLTQMNVYKRKASSCGSNSALRLKDSMQDSTLRRSRRVPVSGPVARIGVVKRPRKGVSNQAHALAVRLDLRWADEFPSACPCGQALGQ